MGFVPAALTPVAPESIFSGSIGTGLDENGRWDSTLSSDEGLRANSLAGGNSNFGERVRRYTRTTWYYRIRWCLWVPFWDNIGINCRFSGRNGMEPSDRDSLWRIWLTQMRSVANANVISACAILLHCNVYISSMTQLPILVPQYLLI